MARSLERIRRHHQSSSAAKLAGMTFSTPAGMGVHPRKAQACIQSIGESSGSGFTLLAGLPILALKDSGDIGFRPPSQRRVRDGF